MELSVTLIALVTVAAFVVPLILVSRGRKVKEKKYLQILSEMAGKNGCAITEHEYFNNTCIGIDRKSNFVFFSRKSEAGELSQAIDLKDVFRSRVMKLSNTVSKEDSAYKVVEKIQLAFSYKDKTRPETFLEFYSNDHDSLTIWELQIAEKWARIINENIVKIPAGR
jgi:hypothetical protein